MADMTTVQSVPVPEPQAHISTTTGNRREDDTDDGLSSLIKLHQWASTGGDISDQLPLATVERLGIDAVREWEIDNGSRQAWVDNAEESLSIAAQETDDEGKDYPFDDASDIHYPMLTVSSQQFAARAVPELIKGDKVVGVKVFTPPAKPSPVDEAQAQGPPQNPQAAQQAQMQMQAQQQQQLQQAQFIKARQARGERVAHFMNWVIFYEMDNWEGETDVLLHEIPIVGAGFKKVYMGESGLCSDYVSALRLTVHNDTKSIYAVPRITQDFDIYPYEMEDKKRAGLYRSIDIPSEGNDPQAPRKFIEQHRLDDLDGDGLDEPYIVTVDVETRQTLRVEPAYTPDDIVINEATDRWLPFPAFFFLPDARGRFYGIGFGKLLASIMDSVDTSINQLIDAGNAEIAGGGFVGGGVRLQGSGQGGSIYFRPGEYQVLAASGVDLKEAVWERTVPHPSAVMMTLLEMLLASAKDIAAVKDVITGDAPSTAPVGTTLALQNQALQVFSSIYKRVYRGFRDEFRLMYQCLKRWGADKYRDKYAELTGGNFEEDFSGDGTDIQPVADPTVVTKMQKISRIQTLMQMAESAVGQSAGMLQPGPAQEIMKEGLDAMDYDRPERFLAAVPPNPEMIAKAQDMAAAAQLKQAQAGSQQAAANVDRAKALRETALAAHDVHGLHQLADQIAMTGSLQPPPEGNENGQTGAQA